MISAASPSDCKKRGMSLEKEGDIFEIRGDVIAKRGGCFSKNIRMFLKLEGDVFGKR